MINIYLVHEHGAAVADLHVEACERNTLFVWTAATSGASQMRRPRAQSLPRRISPHPNTGHKQAPSVCRRAIEACGLAAASTRNVRRCATASLQHPRSAPSPNGPRAIQAGFGERLHRTAAPMAATAAAAWAAARAALRLRTLSSAAAWNAAPGSAAAPAPTPRRRCHCRRLRRPQHWSPQHRSPPLRGLFPRWRRRGRGSPPGCWRSPARSPLGGGGAAGAGTCIHRKNALENCIRRVRLLAESCAPPFWWRWCRRCGNPQEERS